MAGVVDPGGAYSSLWREAILRGVSMAFGVGRDAICGSGRRKAECSARFAAIMLLRDMLGMSYSEAARAVGRSDHSTAMNAYMEAKKALAEDRRFARMVCEAQGFAEVLYASEVRALESESSLKIRVAALESVCGILVDMLDGTREVDLDLLDEIRCLIDRDRINGAQAALVRKWSSARAIDCTPRDD